MISHLIITRAILELPLPFERDNSMKNSPIFKSGKRIKLGIWGLGRGMSFFKTCALLNIDVVAGCDLNEHMRARFKQDMPDALATSSAEEFLSSDFDAVLLATYCPNHADDAIACLKAGKHVLSEVTSFHTMADGVRLVNAVEKSKLVYNLAENYPFSKENMFLAKKWRQGLFGELMYAEYEYLHECRMLAYTYIDGIPVIPGNTVHNWRSWLNFHYYNTHSLGPIMYITGNRPVRVVALPSKQQLAGYPTKGEQGMGKIAPSLIKMNNGGIVRNLMGSTTNDAHLKRIWGTKGAAEIVDGRMTLRLGGSGGSPKFEIIPEWGELGKIAAMTGHGGGDFWVLYYFARQILFGEPAPFDIYTASDCTIPGLLAYRSSEEGGIPFDVPDFRNKRERSKYKNDHFGPLRYNVEKGCFPKNADKILTGEFTTVMSKLIRYTTAYKAFVDWMSVIDVMKEPTKVIDLADRIIQNYSDILETVNKAKTIIKAYPKSDGARVLKEMLELASDDFCKNSNFLLKVKRQRDKIKGNEAVMCGRRKK